MINSQRDFGLIKTSKVHIEKHQRFKIEPLTVQLESSLYNCSQIISVQFPQGFPCGG